ncbi:phosphopantothenoylcysteine decarboxylase isoform 1-T2 [Dama dama]|uniref:phosphopantothenoylcysteine decarboxylase isoform X1 n=1 Tax=Dama dama TaxID=30532 RepID=UPI002A359D77|nr:phosphopantothenoylcysteine decarboxylase isoform X1 [Dama dama]XP_061014958.1 phosphopantothenoylcysteine decarboxylase isoform X1 [Dama dama]
MEPNSGRLPGLEATRPHMEPRAACSAAAPLRRPFHVLVGVTGSVAALKLPVLVSKLLDIPDLKVAVVTTERAKHFYSPRDVPVTLYSDADEWEMWKCRSDPVLHIDLRRWADLMLVAPLDANTLGKVASGICDNLLTCVIRAWDRSKPLLFCPAMNTAMWEHPITEQQVGQLKAFGYIEIPCVAKKLVCGDQGSYRRMCSSPQKGINQERRNKDPLLRIWRQEEWNFLQESQVIQRGCLCDFPSLPCPTPTLAFVNEWCGLCCEEKKKK